MKRVTILLLAVMLITAFLMKDKIIEIMLERSCAFVTGVKLDIGKMKVNILRTTVEIKDMKFYNPETYKDRLMADVPEIYVDYDLRKLLGGTIYLKELRVFLKEIHIIKNSDGKVNLNYLKAVASKADGAEMEKKEKGKIRDIEIELLGLKAGKVVYHNYAVEPPVLREFDVKLDQEYRDINDPYTLIRLIISSVLRNTAISNIISMPMTKVQDILKGAYSAGTSMVKDTVGSTTGAAEKILMDPGAMMKETAKGLTEVLNGSVFKKKPAAE
ncbi:MAG: hypothetical protein ABIG55_06465 [Candidatus Omnitrophota bacterium]|nr:hypothetical protein [Candidatus Omnitrophota bacterium]